MHSMTLNNSYELFGKKEKNGKPSVAGPVIVADRIQSPMNVGAILRLAANINAAKVWFVYETDPGFRSYKIKSTSSGASEKIAWEYIRPEILPEVLPAGYEVVAIETTEDAQNIFQVSLPGKAVFMVGNERYGISSDVLKLAKRKVFIPIPGIISSLNVSHALAIGLFEWQRQRMNDER
jgi:tRNA G18 (ribose-2'-O)-methylase SpoU